VDAEERGQTQACVQEIRLQNSVVRDIDIMIDTSCKAISKMGARGALNDNQKGLMERRKH